MKDDQATGEASCLKREHPEFQNMIFFSFLWLFLALLDPYPIQPTISADPDPQQSTLTTLFVFSPNFLFYYRGGGCQED